MFEIIERRLQHAELEVTTGVHGGGPYGIGTLKASNIFVWHDEFFGPIGSGNIGCAGDVDCGYGRLRYAFSNCGHPVTVIFVR
jgi:hypothetical protein